MTYQTFNAWIVSSSKLGNKTLQKACVKTFGLEITNLSPPKMLCLFEHVMMLSFKQTHLAFFPFPTATAQTLFKWVSTVALVSVEKWFLLYNHFWDVCLKKKKKPPILLSHLLFLYIFHYEDLSVSLLLFLFNSFSVKVKVLIAQLCETLQPHGL